MDRRQFLIAISGASLTTLGTAQAAQAARHVVYPGTSSVDEAREYQGELAVQLGPAVAESLRVVRHAGDYVVIYDRSEVKDPASVDRAERVATSHDKLLRRVFEERRVMASVVSGDDLEQLFDIRYGNPGSVASLKPAWDKVAVMLGPGVAKHLLIEELGDGEHRLVYKRSGDRTSTERVAAHHHRLLADVGLGAAAVSDIFLQVAVDGSTASSAAVALAPATKTVPTTEASLEPTGDLGGKINAHIQGYRRAGKVSSVERTSWFVHDLHADTTLASINRDAPRQAASMIKPYVAVAFLHQVEAGKLVYGPKSTAHMVKMIRDSSNTSTNWLMEQVGGPNACHRLLHKHYAGLFNQLKVVEYIPADGRTYRNLASVGDHGRLLRALWRSELPHSQELRRVMNLPGRDRMYHGVANIPVGTEVYNKTGTTAMCCGDMGILVAKDRAGHRIPYIFIGVIERTNRVDGFTSWIRRRGDVIRSVSGLVYSHLEDRYDLV